MSNLVNEKENVKYQAFVKKICEPLIKRISSNEELKAMIYGQTKPSGCAFLALGTLSMAAVKQYYIGITTDNLLLLQRDIWGRPGEIKRIPLKMINSAKFKKGLLNDMIFLEFDEEPKKLHLQVIFRLREQSMKIVSIIGK